MTPNPLPKLQLRTLLVLLAVTIPAAAAKPARTVFLVRHAERAAGMSAEVGLSEAGRCRAEVLAQMLARCRAEVLAQMLADVGVKSIFATEVARTQQTAEPTAKNLHLKPEVVPAKDVAGLVKKVHTAASNGPVLVVGHSNTVPDIVSRLGGGAVPPIGDAEYDRLYVLTLTGSNQAAVVMLRYPGCAR
jgi:broad specificity phosphatase PhoE